MASSHKKILLLGKHGQLGQVFLSTPILGSLATAQAEHSSASNSLTQSVSHSVNHFTAWGRTELDMSQPTLVYEKVMALAPDIIINTAAYTAVDKAEIEQDLAFQANAHSPAALAKAAKALGSLLIHYSTDYVFDGTKSTNYVETDTPNPLNVYGASKLAGEQAIMDSGAMHLIFRTSWVYSKDGNNFMNTILKLAKTKTELRIINDQFGAPTSANTIAATTLQVLQQITQATDWQTEAAKKSGLYHLTAQGKTTWYGYAKLVLDTYQKEFPNQLACQSLQPIPTSEYPLPAKRPQNSCLNTTKLTTTFNTTLPNFQAEVSRILLSL